MDLLETNLGPDYRLSVSRLKRLLGKFYNPRSFFDSSESITDSDSTIRGTLVEEMLQGIDVEASGKYFFVDEEIKEPSSTIKNIFNSLIVDYPNFQSIPREKLKEKADVENFGGGKYKEETVYDKLKEYEDYYNHQVTLFNNRDKIIVKKSVKEQAEEFYYKAWNSSIYQGFFPIAQDVEWQKEIEFYCFGVPSKGILDLVIRTKQNIVYVIDIKTTELPVLKAYNMFRWDLQMGFYMHGMRQILDPDLYVVGVNIIISKDFDEPLLIQYDEDDLETIFDGSEYKEGLHSLLGKYKYHTTSNDWSMPKNKTINFKEL